MVKKRKGRRVFKVKSSSDSNKPYEGASEIEYDRSITLYLNSKRGKRIGNPVGVCFECGDMRIPLWAYSSTNKGPVQICTKCKRNAFNRSFHKIDALDMVEFKKKIGED